MVASGGRSAGADHVHVERLAGFAVAVATSVDGRRVVHEGRGGEPAGEPRQRLHGERQGGVESEAVGTGRVGAADVSGSGGPGTHESSCEERRSTTSGCSERNR